MSLLGMGFWLLTMADLPTDRIADNCALAFVAATKLMRQLNELLDCPNSSFGIQSRQSSPKQPWSLGGCTITSSIPVESILWWIMLQILSIWLTWISGEEERIYASRRRYTSVHAFLTKWLMVLVLHLHFAPPSGPVFSVTANLPGLRADRDQMMGVLVRLMNIQLISSITDPSLIPIRHIPQKYVQSITSTISVTGNGYLYFSNYCQDNNETRNKLPTSLINICVACKPVFDQVPGYYFPDHSRRLGSKSVDRVKSSPTVVYHCCLGESNHHQSLMHNVSNESIRWNELFITEMYANGASEFLWASSILAISSCH